MSNKKQPKVPEQIYMTVCDKDECCGECYNYYATLSDLADDNGSDVEMPIAVYELKYFKKAKLKLDITEW